LTSKKKGKGTSSSTLGKKKQEEKSDKKIRTSSSRARSGELPGGRKGIMYFLYSEKKPPSLQTREEEGREEGQRVPLIRRETNLGKGKGKTGPRRLLFAVGKKISIFLLLRRGKKEKKKNRADCSKEGGRWPH